MKGWQRGETRGREGGRNGDDGGGVGVPGWGCVELIIFRCLSWRPPRRNPSYLPISLSRSLLRRDRFAF